MGDVANLNDARLRQLQEEATAKVRDALHTLVDSALEVGLEPLVEVCVACEYSMDNFNAIEPMGLGIRLLDMTYRADTMTLAFYDTWDRMLLNTSGESITRVVKVTPPRPMPEPFFLIELDQSHPPWDGEFHADGTHDRVRVLLTELAQDRHLCDVDEEKGTTIVFPAAVAYALGVVELLCTSNEHPERCYHVCFEVATPERVVLQLRRGAWKMRITLEFAYLIDRWLEWLQRYRAVPSTFEPPSTSS